MKSQYIIIFIALILVALLFYYFSYNKENENNEIIEEDRNELVSEKREQDEDIDQNQVEAAIDYIESDIDLAYQEGQEEKVQQLISEKHEYLNQLAGWGNAELLSFDELTESAEWMQLKEDIEWLYEEGFAQSLVINDMLNAEHFVRVAESGDRMSIRYIHRIFHDLDAVINNRDVDRVWGVTHAFGTSRGQQEVTKYLNNTQ